jgi:hypothetical protein
VRGLNVTGWLVLAMTLVTAWAVAWEYIRPRLAALGSWWWRHCRAYWRDLASALHRRPRLKPLPAEHPDLEVVLTPEELAELVWMETRLDQRHLKDAPRRGK